jgi:hypothetical protein
VPFSDTSGGHEFLAGNRHRNVRTLRPDDLALEKQYQRRPVGLRRPVCRYQEDIAACQAAGTAEEHSVAAYIYRFALAGDYFGASVCTNEVESEFDRISRTVPPFVGRPPTFARVLGHVTRSRSALKTPGGFRRNDWTEVLCLYHMAAFGSPWPTVTCTRALRYLRMNYKSCATLRHWRLSPGNIRARPGQIEISPGKDGPNWYAVTGSKPAGLQRTGGYPIRQLIVNIRRRSS